MMYEWESFPFPEKGWRYSRETMAKLDEDGRVWYPKKKTGELDITKRPQLKRYLDEMEGGVMGTVWLDIPPINSQAQATRLPDTKSHWPCWSALLPRAAMKAT